MFSPNLNGIWTLNWLPFSRLLSLIGTQNKRQFIEMTTMEKKEKDEPMNSRSLQSERKPQSSPSKKPASDATVLRRPLVHDFGSLDLQAQMLNHQEISKLALWHLSPQGGHSVTNVWQEGRGKGTWLSLQPYPSELSAVVEMVYSCSSAVSARHTWLLSAWMWLVPLGNWMFHCVSLKLI